MVLLLILNVHFGSLSAFLFRGVFQVLVFFSRLSSFASPALSSSLLFSSFSLVLLLTLCSLQVVLILLQLCLLFQANKRLLLVLVHLLFLLLIQ